MSTTYGILKVLHVLAVVVWIGGVMALTTVLGRLARAGDRTTLTAFFPHGMRYGQTMAGPSSLLVLLTGIPLVIVGHVGFNVLWVQWGFAGILIHFIFGATVMRKSGLALAQAASASPPDDARLAEAGRKVRMMNLIYLLLMVSVIVVMVLKPTL